MMSTDPLEDGLGRVEQLKPIPTPPLDQTDRLYDGMAFADYAADSGPSIWGDGDRVLWSPGEPFMVYGPQGVGKTTLTQGLVLARAGVISELLGLAVQSTERAILYVAADRPVQAARSWRRMVSELDDSARSLVSSRVRFWRGPLPFDIGMEPDKLLAFVEDLGVGTFVADSLKDLAVDLSKDETGSRVNRAWQLLVAAGVECVDLHHPRKGVAGQTHKPKSLDEVYGSAWLTAGHGSVVLLWGSPGDPIVEFSHLKQPVEEVGPFRVIIDHEAGAVAVHEGGDVLAILRSASTGTTAKDMACVLFSTTKPTPAEVEKARRKLARLVDKQLVFERPGKSGGQVEPSLYFAIEDQGRLT